MNHKKAEYYLNKLEMMVHPEGGAFSEVYRSNEMIDGMALPARFKGEARSFSTAIYFLLRAGEFSAFHRIRSDELWHFYDGDPLEIVEINSGGELSVTVMGRDLDNGQRLMHEVPRGTWFGSRVHDRGGFSLVGCTVSPGFDFNDFEMPERNEMLRMFPQHSTIIRELTR
jgi:predicted cupin superfamily sugar epimerase